MEPNIFANIVDVWRWCWTTLWAMPWWFHVFIAGPMYVFIAVRLVNAGMGLARDLVGSPALPEVKKELPKPKKELKEADLSGLINVAVSTVVGVSLIPTIIDSSGRQFELEEVEMAPNQLIQKNNRPGIGVINPTTATTIAVSEQKLKQGFEKVGFERGTKSLTRLESEFKGLRAMLGNSRIDETVLNLKRVAALTDSLYQQGLSFLSQILNVAEQSSASSKEDLLEEGNEIRAAIEKCKPESSLYNMLSERLAKNVEAYNTVKGFSEKLDELFCQVGMCRDSIREIRLGIPELLDNKPKEEYDRTLLELKTRVEMAQRVQAEYTKQGI